jgi:hypothetical protein
MNDKIDQLALQATDSKGGLDRHKFAELIVKMCADAADMAHDARCDCVGDYVGEYMGYGEEQGITTWRAK